MVKIGTRIVVKLPGIPVEYGVVTALKNDGFHDYAVVEGDGFTMTAHDIKDLAEGASYDTLASGVFAV